MSARAVSLHARLLCKAAERRATALRLRDAGQVERAEMAEDEAAETLADANALRDLLADLPHVHTPHPDQLSLLNLPEMHRT